MKLGEFFAKNPIFRTKELVEYLSTKDSRNPSTRNALLAHHLDSGRILRIRRGLYATIPIGVPPDEFSVDPYLLAGKITDDAILAYHTALEAQGRAYSIFTRFTYLTKRNLGQSFEFRGATYQGVSHPKALRRAGKEELFAEVQDRAGIEIKVTSLERSFVDVFDRPNLSGSWEEIWRSLESIEFLDLEKVVEYVSVLENATTAAKVGFFLDRHRDALMVSEEHLDRIRKLCPKSPHYMERGSREKGQLQPDWNLIVPTSILEVEWEEIQ
jgi:predicted transcriptional regulator of viral defense system